MANSWFRLYHEFATDPKVQMMSEADQRRLVMLMCIRCCNGDETFHDEEVAFQLRVTMDEWQASKDVFIRKGFINHDNKILNWDKRQFTSDSSTERVRKHREKLKQDCNVSVTPPDTDTDTDTDKDLSASEDACGYFYLTKKKRKLSGKRLKAFNKFWEIFGYKKDKASAADAWMDIPTLTESLCKKINDAASIECSNRPSQISKGKTPIYAQGWITGRRWEDEHQVDLYVVPKNKDNVIVPKLKPITKNPYAD